MWDLGNSSNWELVSKQTYIAPTVQTTPSKHLPIPTKLIGVNRNVLLIGTRNEKAKPTWFTAGWASPRLNFSPSSSSEFRGLVQGHPRVKLSLNKLNLIKFKTFDLSDYAIEISIAKWHQEMFVEIWQYNGTVDDIDNLDISGVETRLDKIDTNLDEIEVDIEKIEQQGSGTDGGFF